MKSKIVFTLINLIVFTSILTAEDGAGGQAGAFLRRGLSSRALALGNAYTGVTNDVSSVYWNSAGLSHMKGTQLMGMFSLLTLDRQEMFFAVGHNFSNLFSVGVGWYKFGVSDIDGRDYVGNPTKKFDDSENSIMLSVSKKINFVSIGVTAKYLHHSLYDNSATGFGFDIGAKFQFFDIISIGIVAQDLISNLKWNTEKNTEETIPFTLRLGTAVTPKFLPVTLAAEIAKVKDENIIFRVGAEYNIIQYFGLRIGYNNDLVFGGFVKLPITQLDLIVDYAATKDILEDSYVHHITLKFEF